MRTVIQKLQFQHEESDMKKFVKTSALIVTVAAGTASVAAAAGSGEHQGSSHHSDKHDGTGVMMKHTAGHGHSADHNRNLVAGKGHDTDSGAHDHEGQHPAESGPGTMAK